MNKLNNNKTHTNQGEEKKICEKIKQKRNK